MAGAMEPATPSSVMGDSEAQSRAVGTEKDAGTSLRLPDISDVLLASLYPLPKGYHLDPKNRHERRANRALLRDRERLPLVITASPSLA